MKIEIKRHLWVKYGGAIGDRPGGREINYPKHGWNRWGGEIEIV